MEGNRTLLTEFVLRGITDRPELQVPLFLVFFFIYVITMVGNLGLIFLVWKDTHLHTPMYLFLGNLAFADACTSSSVTPKMLMKFLNKNDMISLGECSAQYYFFCFSATAEIFLLVAMAYDRYVAICNPLHYAVVMSKRLCTVLISMSYIIAFINPAVHVGLLFRLTFCKSNVIEHFYCDFLPVYTISCTDPSLNALVIFIFASSIQISTSVTIVVSYARVLFAVLNMKSKKGRKKAFFTCSAHLFSVSLFYGTLLFMYMSPGSAPGKQQDKIYSLFYTVVIPLLNPFIYSLRNKEVLGALKRFIK
ncbi:olfactory receptor 5AC2-like [Peromyscus californicus insignis]|uniref:olfactory receptor 5AC2-like n=1 Tax=Peromyscus californicus insignis TaxID=564181 RepID=UPI0022A784C9|nr:olfactory receptor 5AC2-like [Peromyscus californicus insignis]